jgi:hypothetical protein
MGTVNAVLYGACTVRAQFIIVCRGAACVDVVFMLDSDYGLNF